MATTEEVSMFSLSKADSQRVTTFGGSVSGDDQQNPAKSGVPQLTDFANCQIPTQRSTSPSRGDTGGIDLLELCFEESLSTTCSSSDSQTSTDTKQSYKEKFRRRVKATLSNVKDYEVENAVKSFQSGEHMANQPQEKQDISLPTTALEELDKGDEDLALDTLKLFALRVFAVFSLQYTLLTVWLRLMASNHTLYSTIYSESEMTVALSAITMFGIFALIMRANISLQEQSSHLGLLCLQSVATAYTIGSTVPFFSGLRLDLLALIQLSTSLGLLMYLLVSNDKFFNSRLAASVGVGVAILSGLGCFICGLGSLPQILSISLLGVVSCLAWIVRFVSMADRSKRITPSPLKIRQYTFASMLLFFEIMRLIFQIFVILADKSSEKLASRSGNHKPQQTGRRRMFQFMTESREKEGTQHANKEGVQTHMRHEMHTLPKLAEGSDQKSAEEPTTKHL